MSHSTPENFEEKTAKRLASLFGLLFFRSVTLTFCSFQLQKEFVKKKPKWMRHGLNMFFEMTPFLHSSFCSLMMEMD